MKQKLKKILKYWFIWVAINHMSKGITESMLNLGCSWVDVDPDELDDREGFIYNLGIVEAFYNIKKMIKLYKMV